MRAEVARTLIGVAGDDEAGVDVLGGFRLGLALAFGGGVDWLGGTGAVHLVDSHRPRIDFVGCPASDRVRIIVVV